MLSSAEITTSINAFIERFLDFIVNQSLFKQYGFALFTADGVEVMYYEDSEFIINVLLCIPVLSIRYKWEEVIEYIDTDDNYIYDG